MMGKNDGAENVPGGDGFYTAMLGSIEVTVARLTSLPSEDGTEGHRTGCGTICSTEIDPRLSGAACLYVTNLWELPVMRGVNRKFGMSSTLVKPRTEWEITALKIGRMIQ